METGHENHAWIIEEKFYDHLIYIFIKSAVVYNSDGCCFPQDFRYFD